MSTILEMRIEELEDEIADLKAINQKLQLEKNALKEQLALYGVVKSLKDNEITFHEFTREFCVRTDNDLWLYKGIKYNDLELDLVYKQYINDLNL